tara:strand:- start:122 stop:1096 length:975 start_codon:yes stop_codon:yes gene_type:complete
MSKHSITENLLNGTIAKEPVGDEQGYWAGAPGWYWDKSDQVGYICYRIRRPRGIEPDRGGESRIAKTADFKTFEDVWSVHKDAYESASIEKSILRRGSDGVFRYLTSYVAPEDGRWCVTVNKSDNIESLDAGKTQRLFTATELGLEGIKDPWILAENGKYHLFMSVAIDTASTKDSSHDTLDIFNTGECISATALATSEDLDNWDYQGVILKPEGDSAWDKYCRRINSVLPLNDKYYAFYDGSEGHHQNYEERTGLAVSTDLKNWEILTPDEPCISSPYATGSLRYIDAQLHKDEIRFMYELTRANGSHEMRTTSFAAKDFALE